MQHLITLAGIAVMLGIMISNANIGFTYGKLLSSSVIDALTVIKPFIW